MVARTGGSELREKVEVKRGEMTTKIFEFAAGSVKIISAPAGATVLQGTFTADTGFHGGRHHH